MKKLTLSLTLVAAALAAARWGVPPTESAVASDSPPRLEASSELSADTRVDSSALRETAATESHGDRAGGAGPFRLASPLSARLDSIAAVRDSELLLCLPDSASVVVPRQTAVAPFGVRLEEDCAREAFAWWHNHAASGTTAGDACSLSMEDVGLVLRMQPRWAIVQTQRGERCWWSYGQVVQHALISRERLAPVDSQLQQIPGS